MIKTPLSTVIGGAFWTPGCTVIGGAKLSFEIVMKKLFANGEQGFAYDPNDLTTLYQDAAGTIPVTAAEQPVGLMLDKSKGGALGAELWRDSAVILSGETTKVTQGVYRIYSSNGLYSAVSVSGPLTTGALYKLTLNIDSITVLGGGIAIEGIPTSLLKSPGKKIVYFFATSSLISLKRSDSACDIQISNVSVQQVLGNHAYQTQSAMRPLLVANPQRLDYDTADDKLTTTLPAQLTGCTVIRSVPNVGAQILTNQTIPTIYNDNIDNCGLIVINRALTASETSQITKLFNKAAGV